MSIKTKNPYIPDILDPRIEDPQIRLPFEEIQTERSKLNDQRRSADAYHSADPKHKHAEVASRSRERENSLVKQ